MQVSDFRVVSQSKDGRCAEITSAVGTRHAAKSASGWLFERTLEELDDDGQHLVERFEFIAPKDGN